MEKNAGGEGCDSSYLDRRSRCCAHDKHTPCKQMPCMDYVRKLSSACPYDQLLSAGSDKPHSKKFVEA